MKKITTLFCLLLLKQITVAQSWQDIAKYLNATVLTSPAAN